ncbi:probable chitinase 2 [Halyomorpha halys]|uniref:probable chitinase 2 n=1 Tax=Halyomorpha halys TaxID=286706 RepID=UPI0006D505A3|nr:probable chitinase 2 [Halyomorpha halys]
MGVFLKLLFCFLVIALYNADFIHTKKTTVLCYMAAWSSTRVHQGRFTVADSDTDHCTHIVYAFMAINETTSKIQSVDRLIDLEEGGKGRGQLKELKALKTKNQNIKVLVSVGGYSEGSVKFSEMASSSSKKTTFINSLVKFIRDWELDGIDLCWQFPGQRGGSAADRKNFISLLGDIKRVFQPLGWLLTVHIIAKRHVIDLGYDVKSISQIADYINLAAVEYHGPWDRSTGIMAPLKSINENNVEYMVNYTIQRGAIPSKILLGLPTYGHAYVVQDDIQPGNYLGLFSDQTFLSQYTNEYGIIAYNEICYDIKTVDGWNQELDRDSVTPVAYNGNRFVSYDDKQSLIEKAKLVNKYNLGGVMLWSLDMDDFLGLCHNVRYPLLTAVTEYLDREDGSSSNENHCNKRKKKPVVEEYGK